MLKSFTQTAAVALLLAGSFAAHADRDRLPDYGYPQVDQAPRYDLRNPDYAFRDYNEFLMPGHGGIPGDFRCQVCFIRRVGFDPQLGPIVRVDATDGYSGYKIWSGPAHFVPELINETRSYGLCNEVQVVLSGPVMPPPPPPPVYVPGPQYAPPVFVAPPPPPPIYGHPRPMPPPVYGRPGYYPPRPPVVVPYGHPSRPGPGPGRRW